MFLECESLLKFGVERLYVAFSLVPSFICVITFEEPTDSYTRYIQVEDELHESVYQRLMPPDAVAGIWKRHEGSSAGH